jgi:hypothetical protein
MSRHNTIRASLAVAAAALAIGATSAGAMPIRDGSPALKAPHAVELDAAHASLLREHSATLAAQQSRAFAVAHGTQTRDAAITSGTAMQPVFPDPTALASAQPVANDDGNDVPLIGIIVGLAGAGLLGAGAGVAVTKTTRSRRARVA